MRYFVFILALLCGSASAFDWEYAKGATDVPLEAFSSQREMADWRAGFIRTLKARKIVSDCRLRGRAPIIPGEVRVVGCSFPNGPTLAVTVRAPDNINAAKPAVFVFDPWGASDPANLQFPRDGYVTVEVRFQDWYSALVPLYQQHGYLPVWGAVASEIADQVRTILPPTNGYSVASSATGSLVTPYFVLWQEDRPRAVVTNGVLLSLEWLRRNYRYAAWPNLWNVGNVISYTPVYMTMAPTPVQWQMGESDAFYPNPGPIVSTEQVFSGTPRGQSVDEVLGQFLVLQKGWAVLGGKTFLHTGKNGHGAIDYEAAKRFIEAH